MIGGKSPIRCLNAGKVCQHWAFAAIFYGALCSTSLAQNALPVRSEAAVIGVVPNRAVPNRAATAATPRDLRALRAQIATAIRTVETNEADAATRLYVGHLRFLDSVYSQLMLLDEQAERSFDTEHQFEITTSPTLHLHSFSDFEGLRDRHDQLADQTAKHRQEVESLQSMLRALNSEFGATEQQRRRTKEQLETIVDPAARTANTAKLRLLELRSKIIEELIVLRGKQRDKAARVVASTNGILSGLNDAIATAADEIDFKAADYQQQADQWRAVELFLQTKIARLQQRLAVVESQMKASGTDSALPTDPQVSAYRQHLNNIRSALHQCITETNDTMTYLLLVRQTWTHRYELAQTSADMSRVHKAESDCFRFLSLVQDKQALAKSQGKESIEAFLTPDGSASAEFSALDNEVRQDWREIVETRNRLLSASIRQLNRLQQEIHRRTTQATISAQWTRAKTLLLRLSQHELFAVEDRPITVGKVAKAASLLLVGILLASFLSRGIGTRLLPRLGVHHAASLAIQTISFYSLVLAFGFVTLQALNIPLTVLTFFGGAAAIAVGFGAQNILNNFMSGLIILGERPIRVGDLIEVDGVMGNVEHIGARSTRLRTGNNHEIIIPNSRFLEQRVTNLTLSSFELRTSVSVGVAYGSNPEQVEQLIGRAVSDCNKISTQPSPTVLFREFGNNSLDFEAHFWIRARTVMERLEIESSVRHTINRYFQEQGITIAFPQRDLHVDFSSPIELRVPNPTPSTLTQVFPMGRAAA